MRCFSAIIFPCFSLFNHISSKQNLYVKALLYVIAFPCTSAQGWLIRVAGDGCWLVAVAANEGFAGGYAILHKCPQGFHPVLEADFLSVGDATGVIADWHLMDRVAQPA
jgi:hypothetical protein